MRFWPARTPKRDPHPDPRVEAELRRIESLQATATDREERVTRLRRQIRKLERRRPRNALKVQERRLALDRALDGLAAAEAEAAQLHAEIAAAMDKLGDDVLWLRGDEARA